MQGAGDGQGRLQAWPGQIAVSVDVREGKVAVEGWTKESTVDALDLALRFEDAGVAAMIITDIDRDGTMGLQRRGLRHARRAVTIPVIAAGGVASVDDIAS